MKQYRYVKANIREEELGEYGFFYDSDFTDGYSEPFSEEQLEREIKDYADWLVWTWRRTTGTNWLVCFDIDMEGVKRDLMTKVEEV